QSAFGRMLDPIADKLLISVTLILMVYTDDIYDIHVIAAIIILCRELLVSGLREYLAATSKSLPVSYMAKWKTTAQILSLGFLVVGPGHVYIINVPYIKMIGIILLWIAAILTLYTGYAYLKAGVIHALEDDTSLTK
ncbi:MAG: CDP-alcohol phosphatidyltransferase family protein, partial [Pseudomonadota bacterium]